MKLTKDVALLAASAMLTLEVCIIAGSCAALRSAPAAPEVIERPAFTARVTVYHAVAAQTDDSPLVTADGTHLVPGAERHQRVCAVSRDLLERWGGPLSYGMRLRVTGLSADLDGEWFIHDTMNARFGVTATGRAPVDGKYHVDLLVPVGVLGAWDGVLVEVLGL